MTTTNSIRPSAHGMTLMETLISCMVLSVALTGTLSAWMGAERTECIAREEAYAQAMINKAISQIRSTPFSNIANSLNATRANQTGYGGFSNGPYYSDGTPGSPTFYRLKPGFFKIHLGADGVRGEYNDDALMGVEVSKDPIPGGVRLNDRYYALGNRVPEMRVIIVNTNNPIESQIGEVEGNGDGVDLNQDGKISTNSFPPPAPVDDDMLGTTVEPLFPRQLSPGTDIMDTRYFNISEMQILPVVVQVRWWSAAGMPREITVVTFIANRGS